MVSYESSPCLNVFLLSRKCSGALICRGIPQKFGFSRMLSFAPCSHWCHVRLPRRLGAESCLALPGSEIPHGNPNLLFHKQLAIAKLDATDVVSPQCF